MSKEGWAWIIGILFCVAFVYFGMKGFEGRKGESLLAEAPMVEKSLEESEPKILRWCIIGSLTSSNKTQVLTLGLVEDQSVIWRLEDATKEKAK